MPPPSGPRYCPAHAPLRPSSVLTDRGNLAESLLSYLLDGRANRRPCLWPVTRWRSKPATRRADG
eukprot:12585786-Alexandrium_andersonii.AAC.1